MDKLLNLFEYTDYRAYLTDWLQQAKATKTGSVTLFGVWHLEQKMVSRDGEVI